MWGPLRQDGKQFRIPEQVVRDAVAKVNAGMTWADAATLAGMDMMTLRDRAQSLGCEIRRGHLATSRPSKIRMPESVADLAYLAGILDGEGHITISLKMTDHIRVGITNTDLGLIEWLSKINRKFPKPSNPSKLGKKPIYYWQLSSRMDVLVFLRSVRPFMRIKAAKADEAIAMIEKWIKDRVVD